MPDCLTALSRMITMQLTMNQRTSLPVVRKIMTDFAKTTGLSPVERSPRRYLWTDAFAVCNFLELYRLTGEQQYADLAVRLVDQVHCVLGRHREDDRRKGWISGLSEEEGKAHPTGAGLRIGKKLNERKPDELYNDRLEWDQDGQYFHYLTKWMHALNRVSRVSGDFTYNRWAVELAEAAHKHFVYSPSSGRGKQMYWKMSIDLSYPLVPSMGHHDPLDGFITYSQLQARMMKDPEKDASPDLRGAIQDMVAICEGKDWATDDPLGLGGLLSDSYRVAQLAVEGGFEQARLIGDLLDASLPGLDSCVKGNPFELPAPYRLAFRELGLSIGLRAVERLTGLARKDQEILLRVDGIKKPLASLEHYVPMGERIEAFWLQRSNQQTGPWSEHREINMVMLATSLAPDGFLAL
jgi:hypothetical protein